MKLLIFSVLILTVFGEILIPERYLNAKTLSQGPDEDKNGRVVGGSPVALGQIPYFALIYMTHSSNGNIFMCGGSLIQYNWVLTAAQCIFPPFDQNEVFLGIVNRNLAATWSSGLLGSSSFHFHFAFNPVNFNNDIGLINIPSNPTILLMPSINTIDLPSTADGSINLVGRTATASGFGNTNTGNPSNFLQAVDLTITVSTPCTAAFPQLASLNSICTGNIGAASVCAGDEGGPLVNTIVPGRRALIGVTTVTHPGCATGAPAVFTRVTFHLNWIGSILGWDFVTTTTLATTTTNSTNTTTTTNIPTPPGGATTPRTTTRRGSASIFVLSSTLLSISMAILMITK